METKTTEQLSQNNNNIKNTFDQNKYDPILSQIANIRPQLPEVLLADVDLIYVKTQEIIQCMVNDPRDVASGTHFLDRYLVAIAPTMIQLATTKNAIRKTQAFIQFMQQAQKTLSNLGQAFIKKHQQFLENDVDDLVSELKMLDKLLQSEGLNINQ